MNTPVAGTCTVTILSDTDAYLSYLVTNDDYKRRGLGTYLIHFTLNRIGNRRFFCDAVEEMTNVYRRFGIEVSGTELNIFKARLRSTKSGQGIKLMGEGCSDITAIQIERFTTEALERISKYEKSLSNLDRKIMFSQYLANEENYCCYATNCDGEVSGYAVGKALNKRLILAHLCGEDTITARALLETVVAVFRNRCDCIVLRSPEAASKVAQVLIGTYIEGEVQQTGKLIRMASQMEPFVHWHKVYATPVELWNARQ